MYSYNQLYTLNTIFTFLSNLLITWIDYWPVPPPNWLLTGPLLQTTRTRQRTRRQHHPAFGGREPEGTSSRDWWVSHGDFRSIASSDLHHKPVSSMTTTMFRAFLFDVRHHTHQAFDEVSRRRRKHFGQMTTGLRRKPISLSRLRSRMRTSIFRSSYWA